MPETISQFFGPIHCENVGVFQKLVQASETTTLANFPNSMIYVVQTDAAGDIYLAGN